jgi:hypothetical protein
MRILHLQALPYGEGGDSWCLSVVSMFKTPT